MQLVFFTLYWKSDYRFFYSMKKASFLFKPFFSQVNNKICSIYDSMIPRDRWPISSIFFIQMKEKWFKQKRFILENIWKTPKEVAGHNAKATIQNSANILGPQMNVTTIGASEYISRTQPHLRLRYQVQLPELQTNNKLWSLHKIWLTTPPPPL